MTEYGFTLKAVFCFILIFSTRNIYSQAPSPDGELYLREKSKMNGRAVELLQKYLLFKGYNLGSDGIDGWFGRDTDRALRKYQQDNQLKVTGKITLGDIDTDLPWQPVIRLWDKKKPEKAPGQQKTYQPGDTIRTYYGKLYLPDDKIWNNEKNIFENNVNNSDFLDPVISPSGRFILYTLYSPYLNDEGGAQAVVYDLLTEKAHHFYPQGDFFVLDLFPDLTEKEKYSFDITKVKEIYWTKDEKVYLKMSIGSRSSGKKGFEQAFILSVL